MTTIESEGEFVLLSIGSNIGCRKDNLDNACNLLAESEIVSHIKKSSIYESEPWGFMEQRKYLNAVISGITKYNANELIFICKSLEYFLGRQKREKWHEREIDVDILFYGNSIIDTENLTIPHPRIHERKFVLIPAYEIEPDALNPANQKTISAMMNECTDLSEIELYNHE